MAGARTLAQRIRLRLYARLEGNRSSPANSELDTKVWVDNRYHSILVLADVCFRSRSLVLRSRYSEFCFSSRYVISSCKALTRARQFQFHRVRQMLTHFMQSISLRLTLRLPRHIALMQPRSADCSSRKT